MTTINRTITCLAVLCCLALCGAEPNRDRAASKQPPPAIDAETQNVLDKINSLGPHELPELPLKKERDYARTPRDVTPFHHVKPYKQHFLQQMEYTGPGRAVPEPEHVETVKLGFIGPIEPTVSVATGGRSHEESLGVKMLQGAQLAVEQANARGGYLKRKVPFELVVSNDNGLWGASGNEIINMAYKDKVWAILGTIDGANTHIAIRVALKAEVLMMNSGDTDPTLVETNIPWIVRCIGDDRQQGYLLVDYLYRKLRFKRVGVVRASNRYGRFGVREILDGSRRLGRPVPLEMAYELGSKDFSLHLERLADADVEAVVHWGDAADGARILNQMRAAGMKQPFFACDRCASDEFVKIAGDNAEGVICTYPWDPTRKDESLEAFRAAFRKRFREEPETFAAHAYDGMNMLIWAVQTAGLNRAKIRDMLAYRTKPFQGVTGDIPLSAALDDSGEVFLAKREDGAWKFLSRKDLGLARADKPFFNAREHRTEYAGPGRNTPAPREVDEVLIGYFGPSDPDDSQGGDMWFAAQMAVEEANAAGGYREKPFRLVPGWSENPWGSGVAHVTRMAYTDKVWAVIGGIDGPSTHLAEQVVAKARLPLVSPVSTDKTVNLANVPWMFSLAPGDHLLAPIVAGAIAAETGDAPFVLVSADDHDSRVFTTELNKALSERRMAPDLQVEYRRGKRDVGELVARLVQAKPAAVAIAADADDSARLVAALREEGYTGSIFGGPAMGRQQFLQQAGAAAEGVVFPLLYEPRTTPTGFAKTFARRFGHPPDYAAAHTHDAVRLVLEVIQKAGLNRARIRDAVNDASPWTGAAGTVQWDGLGANTRSARLGSLRNGRVVALTSRLSSDAAE